MSRSAFVPRIITECEKPIIRSERIPSSAASRQTPVSYGHSFARTSPASFSPPAYLDHSAFRDLLHTEHSHYSPSRRTMSPSTDSDEDSVGTPPRETPIHLVSTKDPVFRLPTRWSDSMKNSTLSSGLDGRTLSYQGLSSSGDRDAAAARTDNPIPRACGIYYYEVDILNKGTKGHISIGFAGPQVKLSRLPGWEKNSWGYHGDDGMSFAADRAGTKYGPTYGTGDIIGCGVDFNTHKAFYTINGSFINYVFDNVGRDVDIYPSIGLRHNNEAVRINLGQDPFKFDIEYHVQQARSNTWARILSTPIDLNTLLSAGGANGGQKGKGRTLDPEEVKDSVKHLVLSYLNHHGYVRTAATLSQQFDGPSPSSSTSADVMQRINIVRSISDGNIEGAIQDIRAHYPRSLDADGGIVLVKLKCRRFIELLLESVELKKRMLESQMTSAMDVDSVPHTNGRSPSRSRTISSPSTAVDPQAKAAYETALENAIAFGKQLHREHGTKPPSSPTLTASTATDTGPLTPSPATEIYTIVKRTLGVVAHHDPLTSAPELCSHDARVQLAQEANRAILKSQGLPSRPPLESVYRVTAAYVRQLGMLGEGSAAFADLQRELLDA